MKSSDTCSPPLSGRPAPTTAILLAEVAGLDDRDLLVVLTYLDKGEAKGKAIGEAQVLTRLLEKRFGALPAATRERIFAADVETLDAWVERILDAPNLESIFESN